MNQIKIGRFIADCRRQRSLTQAQVADTLGITDKAVSKWERGLAMPDSSVMLELCDILGISVNELLIGEKIDRESINKKNEQLILDISKELQQKNRTIWTAMWVIMAVSITALIAGLLISALLIPEGPWQLVSILLLCVVFLIPCFYALKLEVGIGSYKCKNCGNQYTEAQMRAFEEAKKAEEKAQKKAEKKAEKEAKKAERKNVRINITINK